MESSRESPRRLLTDNGGLDIDSLFNLMKAGGYGFKETNDDRAKANLKISLGKYVQFDRTSNGYYVVSTKPRKPTSKEDAADGENGSASAAGDEPTANATTAEPAEGGAA